LHIWLPQAMEGRLNRHKILIMLKIKFYNSFFFYC
jgi:hypothetical protein